MMETSKLRKIMKKRYLGMPYSMVASFSFHCVWNNPEEYGYLVKYPLVIFHELSIFLNFLDCQTFFIGSTFNIGVGNEVYL